MYLKEARYRLRKMYFTDQLIEVCCYGLQRYLQGKSKTLEHKIDGNWVTYGPPRKFYQNYTSGYCPFDLKEWTKEIDNAISDR
jgi:hypothetical protein